jgi:hypothetical protein
MECGLRLVDDNGPNRSVLTMILKRLTAFDARPYTTMELKDGDEVRPDILMRTASPRCVLHVRRVAELAGVPSAQVVEYFASNRPHPDIILMDRCENGAHRAAR